LTVASSFRSGTTIDTRRRRAARLKATSASSRAVSTRGRSAAWAISLLEAAITAG